MSRVRKVLAHLAAAGVAGATLVAVSPDPALAASCPSWPDPVPAAGAITNTSSVGIGVIHLADGNCAHNGYDVVLPPGQDTYHYFGWREVAGAYIGSGYNYVATSSSGSIISFGTGPATVTRAGGGNWSVRAIKS